MPKNLLPVAAQPFQTHGQELGGKMLNLNPGQNQKADIVDHQMKVFPLGLFSPANEDIPIPDLPGCRCPSEACHNLAVNRNLILQMLANQFRKPQVMVMMNKVIPAVAPTSSNDLEGWRWVVRNGTGQGFINRKRNLAIGLNKGVIFFTQAGRQTDEPLLFQT
ncbi:MAG: hypothetical protein A2X96_11825 [Syntrophobacterales bacterium GWC2_56_13]|nr:MAG: hypothetical protein A2X96_11825 [Syntrophobacterales bacterium GWC2_56_13]